MTYVDLDLGQGSITIPAVVAATPIDKPVDIEDGSPLFALAHLDRVLIVLHGVGFGVFSTPVVYFYGDVSPGSNPKLYVQQMRLLNESVNKRLEKNRNGMRSSPFFFLYHCEFYVNLFLSGCIGHGHQYVWLG